MVRLRGPLFDRHVGIDYSGAASPDTSLPGLRVYLAAKDSPPEEIRPTGDPRRNWTRRGVAAWLVAFLREEAATIVGIDHGFSFPERYFEKHGIAREWQAFLEDFRLHWPTDEAPVELARDGRRGAAAARAGSARWRRLTEVRAGAKSVFHFDVPGSVAKSTHGGLPWLLHLRRALGARAHFWPFDGWIVPRGRSVLAEVYPSLWSPGFPRRGRTADQHDAFSVAAWLQRADAEGLLPEVLEPELTPAEREIARIEGWILGIP